MHLGELAEWCLNNSKVPADTEEMQDEPFVVCYSVFLGDEDEVPVDHFTWLITWCHMAPIGANIWRHLAPSGGAKN